jgi:hypothetical protein
MKSLIHNHDLGGVALGIHDLHRLLLKGVKDNDLAVPR